MATNDSSGVSYDQLLTPVSLRVGKAAAKHLANLGIETVGDALNYAPRKYFHWGKLTELSWMQEDEDVTVLAQVVGTSLVRNRSGNGVRLLVNITDGHTQVTCTFFAKNAYALTRHQKLLQPGESFLFAGKVSNYRGTKQLIQPTFEHIEQESPEAIERRRGRPIPIYRATSALPSWKVKALIDQVLGQVDWQKIPELLPKKDREENGLLQTAQAYQLLHSPRTDTDWQQAWRTLAWQEALVLQSALLQPKYALLKDHGAAPSGKNDRRLAYPIVPALNRDSQTDSVEELISSLPFQLTEGQQESWKVIQKDLAGHIPMQRLLQADVGAGKTVVALLAMVSAVQAGYQAAFLVPTEVLAKQHLTSLQKLLGRLQEKIPVYLLTSAQSAQAKKEVLENLANGQPAIVVGTHALLQDSVSLPKLDLLVVDEQHRFGVGQREKLREGMGHTAHLLVMTATPIPRTIAMTAFGDLDTTVMTQMPQGRHPITTFVVDIENSRWLERLWQRAAEEIAGGGRVYVVCPLIDSEKSALPSIENTLPYLESQSALADINIAVAHGKRSAEENQQAFAAFTTGQSPLMLATTIVEVGVDVPEATMMVVLGAGQFGLSQLHQLRGRVGRSDRESICVLVASSQISPTGKKRLQILADTSDGFVLAEEDLRLRHEGDVLGDQQSGGRSSLKFLSVRSDAALIGAAREKAQQLLSADPQLQQYPQLAQAIDDLGGATVAWLERS